jgi:FtsX-like permease family/FAD binding domain
VPICRGFATIDRVETAWDAVVVGGGAAGLSAALVLGRARQRTLVIDAGAQSHLAAEGIGGLVGQDGRSPAACYAAGREELARYPSVQLLDGDVLRGERDGDGFVLELAAGGRVTTRRVILTTGKATAGKYHFALGDRVLVNLPNQPETFTIAGLVTFGSDDNLAGITLAGFDPPTAQALFNSRGHYDTISVLAARGANTVKLQRVIAAILPAGIVLVLVGMSRASIGLVGLSLVSTIAVLGASLSASAKTSVDNAISADYIVTGKGGFSKSVVPAVSQLPGVSTTTVVYQGQFEVGRSLTTLTAATPADLASTVNLHMTAGSGAPAMAAGELLVDTTTATKDHVHVGSTVPIKFAQTGSTTITVGGIFKSNPLLGSYVTGDGFFLSHFDNPLPVAVLLSGSPHGLNQALQPYANVSAKTRHQFEASQQASVNQLLGLVYVLLALAILIALIGIVNTLMLSVFERTHEIGLLRAVGMKRRQVRAMIRSEAVIVGLFGGVLGIVRGTALGAALAYALRNNGVTTVHVPVASPIAFVVLSAALALAAATWPARRAASLDVLAAIAAE